MTYVLGHWGFAGIGLSAAETWLVASLSAVRGASGSSWLERSSRSWSGGFTTAATPP
ncbi:hypothetical protein [Streptomyces sp. NPDC127190]|uniref:hypothetical protein n=1 Tax=unclassified Streptomyces TaxID=2593676 RepID=UPI003635BF07